MIPKKMSIVCLSICFVDKKTMRDIILLIEIAVVC